MASIANVVFRGLAATRTSLAATSLRLAQRIDPAGEAPRQAAAPAAVSAPPPQTFLGAMTAQTITLLSGDPAGASAAGPSEDAAASSVPSRNVAAARDLLGARDRDVAALDRLERQEALTRSLVDVIRAQENGVRRLFGVAPDERPLTPLSAGDAQTNLGAERLAEALARATARAAAPPAETIGETAPEPGGEAAPPPAEPVPVADPLDPTGGWRLYFSTDNAAAQEVVSGIGLLLSRDNGAQNVALAAGAMYTKVDLNDGYNTFDSADAAFLGTYEGGRHQDEVLIGAAGAAYVDTRDGNDVLIATGTVALAEMGAGADYAVLQNGGTVDGGAGDDILQDGDVLAGADVSSTLRGGDGNDTLNVYVTDYARMQRDSFDGGAGTDTVTIRIKSEFTGQARIDAIMAELDGLGGTAPASLETLSLDLTGVERINLVIDGVEVRSLAF